MYALPLPGRRWACVQVVGPGEKDRVELVTLEGLFDAVPTIEAASKLRFLRANFAAWRDHLDRKFVESEVPWNAVFVGNVAPVERLDGECNAWGGWSAVSPFLQWRWHHLLREEDRRRYVGGVARSEIAIDLGAGPSMQRRDTWRLWLGPNGLIPLPEKNIEWTALDALPLTELSYEGDDARFLDYVRSNRLLSHVTWTTHGQREIDLRDTTLTDLGIGGSSAPIRLLVPRHLMSLRLLGPADRIEIVADDASRIDVSLLGPELPARTIPGLESIETLAAWELRVADVKRLAGYTRLADLDLRGAPGSIVNVASLRTLTELRSLQLRELYDLDAEAFPEGSPKLERVTVHGLRKTAAPILKKKLAGVPDVRVTGARDDAWIATNLENPFREWEEEDRRMGKAACDAWRKAMKSANDAGRGATKRTAESILKAFVHALNAIDEKHGLDTLRREEAGEAFAELARHFDKIAEDDVAIWFDRWRDF